jgi:mRNA-degrading endonuclease RelE of RelBE toxin-antitoxin system
VDATVREFEVLVHPRVQRELRDLERAGRGHVVRRIREAMERMKDDPFTPRPGFDTRPTPGEGEDICRVRIGTYRVLYHADENLRVVRVLRISHRKGAYRD